MFNQKANKLCRICLKDDKFKVSIFCDYAKKIELHSRIQKYLRIKIQSDDEHPKHICYQCLSNLELIENFIDKAHESQNILKVEDERSTGNYFFDDQSLQTPPDMIHAHTKNNVKNKSLNRINSLNVEVDSDSEKLFSTRAPKQSFGKSFKANDDSFDNHGYANFKRFKTSSSVDLTEKKSNAQRPKNLLGSTSEDNQSSKHKDMLQKKKSVMKIYQDKFEMFKNN